jgi:peroxiredoxin Q/BCP
VKVVGVSPDGAEKHVAFRAKYGLKFDLLSDPDKKVMEKYGAYGEKMMYGKKVTGVIRSTFVIGPTGKIEQAWYGVRADGHAAKVLSSLEGRFVVATHRADPVPKSEGNTQHHEGDDRDTPPS